MNMKSSIMHSRAGISVLEVLSAMLVALIGIAGVLVMIPFATKQGQVGLDLDRSNTVAENAIAMLELGEHDRVIAGAPTWIADAAGTRLAAPATVAIDPLGVIENGFASYGQFPPLSSITAASMNPNLGDMTDFPVIATMNLSNYVPSNPAGSEFVTFLKSDARRLCVNRDALVFNTEKDATGADLAELAPPLQVFDIDVASGLTLRRQYRGDVSWMSVMVPHLDSPTEIGSAPDNWKFEQNILVFKDRTLDQSNIIFPIAQVDLVEMGYGSDSGNADFLRTGSTVILYGEATDVRKNDWIMLLNQDPDLEDGYEVQVAFHRVIGLGATYRSRIDGNPRTPITLDGPNFSLRNADSTVPAVYAVHLVNFANTFPAETERKGHVVNVYQRTMRLKKDSVWHK